MLSGHVTECGGCGLMVGVPGAYWPMIQYVPGCEVIGVVYKSGGCGLAT